MDANLKEELESTDFWDQVGMTLSSICALHCLITPFVAFSLPLMTASLHHPLFHVGVAVFVLPVGAYSFWRGFRGHHKKSILFLGLAGLLIVVGAAIVPHAWLHLFGHDVIMIVGSVFLITAHYLNRRACQCGRH